MGQFIPGNIEVSGPIPLHVRHGPVDVSARISGIDRYGLGQIVDGQVCVAISSALQVGDTPAVVGVAGADRARGSSGGTAPALKGTVREMSAAPQIPPGQGPGVEGFNSIGGSATVNDAAYDLTFFKHYGVNPFIDAEDDRLSTFAMDVDTASYTVARRFVQDGYLPDSDSIRVDEFVNFFDHGYPRPEQEAFAIHVEGSPSPFGGGEPLADAGRTSR